MSDNLVLTLEDYQAAADNLGVDVPAVIAVARIESSGAPFIKEGYPTILFEGHIFWKELKKRGIDPYHVLDERPEANDILFPKWVRKYKGGMAEYTRLDRACAINEDAALCSASWGAFQIMGFNHTACAFETVQGFVAAQKRSAGDQLLSFCEFMRQNKLVRLLRAHDWAGFALRYNGAGYKKNAYDTKLAAEYRKAAQNYG